MKAKEEIEWLINRDYKVDPVVTFVGDRYQFSIRQRDALKRAVCTDEKNIIRQSKRLSLDKIKENTVNIDGFNKCISYFNVARSIIEEYIKDCNIVNLNK
ncbi:DUF434 domain-containing protein [Clostridioides sp. ZZV15-6383]|uniref:DUF434 domain-containing protein n=1 Tax=Clostridioides sp. ZZV15-6383 TaxID=2811498 RepID=UPI000D1E5194|nr:DUF434 domain-containing protein [Clostridioides sp. ZZV15-6383]